MNNSLESPSESFLRHTSNNGVDPLSPTMSPLSLQDNSNPTSTANTTRKLLVIYCGGTMGMKWIDGSGYVPVSGHLFHILTRLPYFNDPECSLSHNCPSSPSSPNASVSALDSSLLTPPLIIPATPSGPAIYYNILEHPNLLDSSNMSMDDWALIASEVETWYAHFDGFVVIHGTDTLAYTAAALSFMLESLGKPVILTGSQIPFSELRTDAVDNLLGAMLMAAHHPEIKEVCVYFAHKLYRGNRVNKVSNDALSAFDSLNYGVLGEAGVRIRVHHERLLGQCHRSTLLVHRHLDRNVAVLRVFPGISADAFRSLLAPPIRGVVLATFGTGNMPNNRPDLVEALEDARSRGVIIVNVSQCQRGMVPPTGMYATGSFLDTLGIVSGSDMTVECALAKLSFLLSFPSLSPGNIKSMLAQSLRGELTEPHRQLWCAATLQAILDDDQCRLQKLVQEECGNGEVARMRPFPLLTGFNLLHLACYLNREKCAEMIEKAAPILAQVKDISGRLPKDLKQATPHNDSIHGNRNI